MNTENDDLGAQLTRELRRRTDGMHGLDGTPLTFEDVRGKATSIRRRRQLATGLGVAAAVAVIVPTAMFATKGTNADGPNPVTQPPTAVDTNGSTPPATPTAEPTTEPTVTPTMGSNPHALDVSDLPTGAAPAVPLVTNGDFAAARTSEALVRLTSDGVVVEAGGQEFGPYPSSTGIARNPAATAVAWANDEGEVMAWADGASEPFTVVDSDLESVGVAAVTGTSCTPGEAGDCLFYVSGYDMATNLNESFTVTPSGDIADVDPDRLIVNVNDATDDGRVLGLTEISDGGSCSALLDPATSGSEPVFDTCDYTLEEFSPNGDHVLASEPYHSGIGASTIAVFTKDGDLLSYRQNRTQDLVFYNDAVWEDDNHVLFSVFQDGAWSVVRMDVDGAMEYAIAPEPGNQDNVPWHFETR